MTIALGILATDGIVIAADTQETIDRTKVPGEKVLISVTKRGVLAVTGAGSAGYLDAMAQQVTDAILATSNTDIEWLIRHSFESFYVKHIVPLYPFPHHFENPDIEAIFGVDWQGRRILLTNEQTAISRRDRFVAVGAGKRQATMILGRTFGSELQLTLERAALLAAYTIYEVGQSVEGCGKNTQVFMLRDGKCSTFWHWDQEKLDREFKRYSDAEMVLLHHVLGSGVPIDNVLPVFEMIRVAIGAAAQTVRLIGSPTPSPERKQKHRASRRVPRRTTRDR